MLLNPWVEGESEPDELDPHELRIQFDEVRSLDGLDVAKEAFPDWEEFTLPGDPYPIPRSGMSESLTVPKERTPGAVKGDHGFLVDTNVEGWAEKLVSAIRRRETEDAEADT